MHSILPLEYDHNKEVSTKGIPDFLSPTAFSIAWTQYQSHCLDKLNTLVPGMSLPVSELDVQLAGR